MVFRKGTYAYGPGRVPIVSGQYQWSTHLTNHGVYRLTPRKPGKPPGESPNNHLRQSVTLTGHFARNTNTSFVHNLCTILMILRACQIVCPDARDNQFEVPGYRHMSR